MMIRVSIAVLASVLFLGAISLSTVAPEEDTAAETHTTTTALCEFDSQRSLSEPIEELLREDDPALGNPESDVIVVEFFDPNCSHCQSFHPTWNQVVETYEDRVRFHKLPLPLWPYSLPQVEAMLVAKRAGLYYEMIDKQMELGRNQGISIEELAELGAELGFDEDRFAEVLQRGPLQGEVQERRRRYTMAGVQSTPTVTINGQTVTDRSFTCLSQKIDEALAAAE